MCLTTLIHDFDMKQLLLKYNLTNDNALVILSSLAGMLMLAPLSVYRFITGNYGVAGVDFFNSLSFVGDGCT